MATQGTDRFKRDVDNIVWQDEIVPYVSGVPDIGAGVPIFNCPSRPRTDCDFRYKGIANPNSSQDDQIWLIGSYAANLGHKGATSGEGGPFGDSGATSDDPSPIKAFARRLATIKTPATTVAVFDARIPSTTVGTGPGNTRPWAAIRLEVPEALSASTMDGAPMVKSPDTQDKARMIAAHLETGNFLYADGHVKAQKLDSILADKVTKVISGTSRTFYSALTNAND